jgi:Peptidase MA superfamily
MSTARNDRGRAAAFAIVLLAALMAGAPCHGETLSRGAVRVMYSDGDEAAAQRALASVADAVDDLSSRLPAGDSPIIVKLCGTHGDFARYAGTYARTNVAGVAMADEGFIAVKTPRLLEGRSGFEGTLTHELVHVLLARNTDVDVLPRWLNEGIAMTLSREHRFNATFHTGRMYFQNRLIPYARLDWAFMTPGVEMEFGDAYAQGLSMTRYLRESVGEDAFWAIVRDLDTMTFPEALAFHGNMSVDAFYESWQHSLWKVALVFSIVSGFSLFQIMALLTIVAYLRKRRQGRRLMHRWQREEEEEDAFLTVRDLEDQEGPYPWEEEEGEL